MWCPKCKSEYRKGHQICPECGEVLVNELPHEPPKEQTSLGVGGFEPALLTTVSDDIEFVTIEAFLHEQGIPCMKKHKGSGSYMEITLGKSVFGLEIYVPKDKLFEAREVLDSVYNLSEMLPEDE